MHLKVRDLYKRVLIVGRDYPGITARRAASSLTVLVRCLAQARTPATAEVHLAVCLGQAGSSRCGARPRSGSFKTAT